MKKKSKKYYEKLSLEEAEKQIRELVREYLTTEDAFKKLRDERDRRWPTASWIDPPKDKGYVKLQKALDVEIRKNSDTHSELFDLVRTIPIPKNKRTCNNCAFSLCRKRLDCEKRGISNKVYCNQYRQPNLEEGFVYIKAHFMTAKEQAIEAAKTFEDHVNDMVKQELDTYKKTLVQLDEHLAKVEVEETTIAPKDILDKFEREAKQIKKSMKAWGACYDRKRVKEGLFKGGYVWTPNKKRFKKLAERNAKAKKKTMCPMQAFAASVGLTKVEDDE